MKYLVLHDYEAVVFGGIKHQYHAGNIVELAPIFANWINRDSPGTLAEVEPDPPAVQPPADRMIKAPGKRR